MKEPEIKKILCAVDFSEPTPKVAAYARALARKTGAEVIALYVSPTMNRYAKLYVAPQMISALTDEILKGAQSSMLALIDESFAEVPARGLVEQGYAPEAINLVAAREGVDLIVMGTHGRRGADRIIFGSVAEKVVKSSKIPVLTIRP